MINKADHQQALTHLDVGSQAEAHSKAPKAKIWGLLGLWGVVALSLLVQVSKSAVRTVSTTVSKAIEAVSEPPRREEQERGRQADRDLAPQRETDGHERWGTLFVALALLVAVTGGVGFLLAYWNFSDTQILGGTMALFLGGLGVALVFHARWLMPDLQATQPREQLESPPSEREAAGQDFGEGVHEIHRRSLFQTIAIIAGGFITAIVVSMFRSLGSPPEPSLQSTIWKRGQRLMTSEGKPVSVDTLEPGSTLIVFPEDQIDAERAQTVLIRATEGMFQLPPGRASWVPKGYVAYSRVCTHAGCPVGLYEATTQLLMCPCHQSTFDILRAARPTGGPAARALPQLPLYVDDQGLLRAAAGFTEPPGPGFWSLPS